MKIKCLYFAFLATLTFSANANSSTDSTIDKLEAKQAFMVKKLLVKKGRLIDPKISKELMAEKEEYIDNKKTLAIKK